MSAMAGVLHIKPSSAEDEQTETKKMTTQSYRTKVVLCNIVKFVKLSWQSKISCRGSDRFGVQEYIVK